MTLIGLSKQKGVVGYPGDGANLWPAMHARDLTSLFRLALEKGPAGKHWHGIEGEGLPFARSPKPLAAVWASRS